MKKVIISVFTAVTIIGLFGCSEDFEVAAPYKNVTLVYGLLNINDTAHYIKIQKAFLDEQKSALDMAKVPDSNFYPEANLQVVIREIAGTNVIKNITLNRVDLNLEGYQKDTGVFFSSPNYAYKFKEQLNASSRYRLVVTNSAAGFKDSSEINVLDSTLYSTKFVPGFKFNFARTVPTAAAKLDVFCLVPANASYIEAKMKFRWVEKNTATGVQADKEAEFIFGDEPITQTAFNLSSSNIAFYTFLRSAMGKAPANVERYMDSCDFYLTVAGKELTDYITVTKSQSSGLTADQLKPLYTNILGVDVYGLFSSRSFKLYKNIPLTDETLDSFKINNVTSDLNIRGRSDH